MKKLLLKLALSIVPVALCLGPAVAHTDTGHAPKDEEGIGSLPKATKVKKGQCHTNASGSSVCTDPNSGGWARMSPATGTPNDTTTVTTQPHHSGTVTLDQTGDSADVGHHSNDTVTSSNGGTTTTLNGTGSTVTVTNNGTPQSTDVVHHPGSGSPTIVYGGTSRTIQT